MKARTKREKKAAGEDTHDQRGNATDQAMNVTIKGKNLEVSEALHGYAEKKAAKIARLIATKPISVQITMSTERGLHGVDVTVQLRDLLLRGEEKTGDMYASIDGAIDKIERQIRKYKTKINRRPHTEDAIIAPDRAGEETAVDEPAVLRTKRFAFKPMSVDEAIMQMELLAHDFFVFSNAETEEVNVVYRRKDGNYGLIEPEF